MITENPYKHTSDDIIFSICAIKNDIAQKSLKKEREKFFLKGQAWFRSSPLPKRYGWGYIIAARAKLPSMRWSRKTIKNLKIYIFR